MRDIAAALVESARFVAVADGLRNDDDRQAHMADAFADVTCASGANAVLMTVTVGTPRSSSAAASRAVQGVEEPQWPTPLMTASHWAAISFAYGEGTPR